MDHSEHMAFPESVYMPHGHCYLWQTDLVYTHVISDLLIGLAYFAISITLYVLIRRIKIPFSAVILCFGIFIGACGVTHFLEIWTLWHADYWFSGIIKVITATASVFTGVYLFKLRHGIVAFAELARLSEKRRIDLEVLTKSLEERVSERTAELERALKLREDFLSIVSHELRTPLSGLKMQLQLVARRLAKNDAKLLTAEGIQEVTEICERQTDQLLHLIEDILDVSRIQSGRLSVELIKTDLHQLLQGAVKSFEKQFEASKMKLTFQSAGELFVRADAQRLLQVIGNLLTNALKYGNFNPVEVSLEKDGGDAVLKVSDHGLGISEDSLERIFESFERAVSHDHISGMGLGLFICKQIVEGHNGSISVTSRLNKGSIFEVRIPLYKDAEQNHSSDHR